MAGDRVTLPIVLQDVVRVADPIGRNLGQGGGAGIGVVEGIANPRADPENSPSARLSSLPRTGSPRPSHRAVARRATPVVVADCPAPVCASAPQTDYLKSYRDYLSKYAGSMGEDQGVTDATNQLNDIQNLHYLPYLILATIRDGDIVIYIVQTIHQHHLQSVQSL